MCWHLPWAGVCSPGWGAMGTGGAVWWEWERVPVPSRLPQQPKQVGAPCRGRGSRGAQHHGLGQDEPLFGQWDGGRFPHDTA